MTDEERLSTGVDSSWAIRPENADHVEPLFKLLAETPRARILDRSKLVGQAARSEQRDEFLMCCKKTSIREPHKEVQSGRRPSQDFNCFKICRYRMSVDLSIDGVIRSKCL